MRTYKELTLEEWMDIQQRRESDDGLRAIGWSLGRATSTISRECRREGFSAATYNKAQAAQ